MAILQNEDVNIQKSTIERPINRGFFDRTHPAESIGYFVISGIIAVIYLYKVWIDVIRSLVQKEPLTEALRQKFNNNVSNNSFDEDDTLMYLKSIFPLIIDSVRAALDTNDLLKEDIVDKLDKFLETGQQVINVDTGGGNILGSILGGKSNKINN